MWVSLRRIGAGMAMLAVFQLALAARPADCSSYLYVSGHNGWTTTVWYAPVLAGGALAAWQTTSPYPIAVGEHWMTTIGSDVYGVCGAWTGTVATAGATVGGPLGSWSVATPVPSPYYQPVVVPDSAGTHLYLLGGINIGGVATSDAWSAAATGGTVGPWISQAPLPLVTWEHSGCGANGYLFVFNCGCGYSGPPGLWSAPASAGTIGSWSSQALPPVAGTTNMMTACGSYLYAAGGTLSSAYLSDVYFAPVSSGNVGSWLSTSPLPVGAVEFALTVADGYLYCAGGYPTSGGAISSVYYAQILTGGGLSSWQSTSPMPAVRAEHQAVAVCFNAQGTPVDCCQPAPTPTATATIDPSFSPTPSNTRTVSRTATRSASSTGSASLTLTPSCSQSNSVSPTATWSGSPAPSATAMATSHTPTATETQAAPELRVDRNVFRAGIDQVRIEFGSAKGGPARVAVFNSAGELIRVIANLATQPQLVEIVAWNGTLPNATLVSSNVYVIELRVASVRRVVKVAVIR